jgi:hypothetical protein
VSVGAALERQVAFEWYESVAIVGGICSAAGPGDTEFVPAWQDCLITPEGDIVLRSGAGAGAPVSELPRLLHALLGRSIPAPLRLFVVHAISSNSCQSARSFGEALAFYERPNRTENLQSAYQRYFETPAKLPQEPPPIEEPEQPMVNKGTVRAGARARRIRMAVVIAAPVCASVGWFVFAGRLGPMRFDAPRAIVTLAERAGVATTAGGEVFPLAHTEMPPVDATGPEPPPARRTLRRSTSRPMPSLNAPPVATELPTARAAAPAVEQLAVMADLTSTETPSSSMETVIYTSASAGVVAPVLLDPVRLPAAVRAADGRTGAVMELIVTEAGTVERARFLTPPERMTDLMLLSAAKAWVFRPGTKDGRPVSYRVVTDWSSLR